MTGKAIHLVCKKCGGDSFRMRWPYETESDLTKLVFCHDGFGYTANDSIITCSKCGAEAPWEYDDFTTTEDQPEWESRR